MFTHCWIKDGPASATLAQQWSNIGWTSRVCWEQRIQFSSRFTEVVALFFFWSCVMLIHNTCGRSASPLWNFRSMLLLSSHVLLRPQHAKRPNLCSEEKSLLSCKVSSYCLLPSTSDMQHYVYLDRISAMATRFSPNKLITRYLGYLATHRDIRKERSIF